MKARGRLKNDENKSENISLKKKWDKDSQNKYRDDIRNKNKNKNKNDKMKK